MEEDDEVQNEEDMCNMVIINAIDYRLKDEDLLKLKNARECGFGHAELSVIFLAMKDAILSSEQIDFLIAHPLYAIQMQQVVLGFENGLSIFQVETYAKRNISAKKWKKQE